MTDSGSWLEHPLISERPLIVYVDFKSPYAYLAIQPTREIAEQCAIRIDWRPLVLDIPSFLGSARLDQSGKVVAQRRSAQQWSGVKYAYFDCRRYANLRGVTVRGTVKIWDTNLAAVGMLWAKQQSDEILDRYLDGIFAPFWKRQLDVEAVQVIRRVLRHAGADLSGFDAYANGQGAKDNDTLQQSAFTAGIFGVPSYVIGEQVYFGREHLPRVAWHLAGEPGAAPDVSYSVGPTAVSPPGEVAEKTLEICIDFASPLSYLCIAPVLRLAEETGALLNWRAISGPPLKPPLAAMAGDDRGTQHRRLRAEYMARDIARYAPHRLDDLYSDVDRGIAIMGLLWLKQTAPAMVTGYIQAVFARYWRDHRAISGVSDIVEILTHLGAGADEFLTYAQDSGAAEVERSQRQVAARGVSGTPTFFVEGEAFVGRQHFPLIKQKLSSS